MRKALAATFCLCLLLKLPQLSAVQTNFGLASTLQHILNELSRHLRVVLQLYELCRMPALRQQERCFLHRPLQTVNDTVDALYDNSVLTNDVSTMT